MQTFLDNLGHPAHTISDGKREMLLSTAEHKLSPQKTLSQIGRMTSIRQMENVGSTQAILMANSEQQLVSLQVIEFQFKQV